MNIAKVPVPVPVLVRMIPKRAVEEANYLIDAFKADVQMYIDDLIDAFMADIEKYI